MRHLDHLTDKNAKNFIGRRVAVSGSDRTIGTIVAAYPESGEIAVDVFFESRALALDVRDDSTISGTVFREVSGNVMANEGRSNIDYYQTMLNVKGVSPPRGYAHAGYYVINEGYAIGPSGTDDSERLTQRIYFSGTVTFHSQVYAAANNTESINQLILVN